MGGSEGGGSFILSAEKKDFFDASGWEKAWVSEKLFSLRKGKERPHAQRPTLALEHTPTCPMPIAPTGTCTNLLLKSSIDERTSTKDGIRHVSIVSVRIFDANE